jgi:hypothetical protein
MLWVIPDDRAAPLALSVLIVGGLCVLLGSLILPFHSEPRGVSYGQAFTLQAGEMVEVNHRLFLRLENLQPDPTCSSNLKCLPFRPAQARVLAFSKDGLEQIKLSAKEIHVLEHSIRLLPADATTNQATFLVQHDDHFKQPIQPEN